MVCGTWCSEDENPCPRCASEVDHPIKCPNCDEVIEDPEMCELCYWELDTGETAPEEAPEEYVWTTVAADTPSQSAGSRSHGNKRGFRIPKGRVALVLLTLWIIGTIGSACEDKNDEGTGVAAAIPATTEIIISSATTQNVDPLLVLAAVYEWGYTEKTKDLQQVLNIDVDGWYGPQTRVAHLVELERSGMGVNGVPDRPPLLVEGVWDEVNDIKVDCEFVTPKGPVLHIEVKNNSSMESKYEIEVLFESADGVVQHGVFSVVIHGAIQFYENSIYSGMAKTVHSFTLRENGLSSNEISELVNHAAGDDPTSTVCVLKKVERSWDTGPGRGNQARGIIVDQQWIK
jgi:hypothetical protein